MSITDPDARSSRHGKWFDGYMVDVLVDADSEIITQINVLSGSSGNNVRESLRRSRDSIVNS